MANTLKVKRSATPDKVPLTTDLDLGEIAVNTYNGRLFIKKNNGTESIVEIGAGSGFSGSYNDLSNKPSIPSGLDDLSDVALSSPSTGQVLKYNGTSWANASDSTFSGSYNDLTDKPSFATVATSGAYSDLSGTPSLATVATSGSYTDLTNKPSLATVATSGSYTDLTNKPSLATVATSGAYSDLSGTPTLATVATSGSYTDLTSKPTIPSALDDLSDVIVTSAAKGQFIVHDGSSFVNSRTIQADAAGTKPLIVKGAASQTANLFEVQNSSGTSLFSLSSAGTTMSLSPATGSSLTFDMIVNFIPLRMGIAFQQYGSYTGPFIGAPSDFQPLSFRTGGSLTYEAMRIEGYQQNSLIPRIGIGTNTFGAQLAVKTASASRKGLTVQAASSQSANVFEVQDSSGNNLVAVNPSGDVTIQGNVTINGTTQTVNSTTVTLDDPILTLGGDTAPTVDDSKDRGIEFRWHNGSAAKVGFFGFDRSSTKFTLIPDATNTSEVFSGTQGDAAFNTIESTVATGTAPLTVASTTAVTNLNADMLDGYHASTFILPPGMMAPYAGTSAPTGWLLCQGQAVSRTAYGTLFGVIGTTYGVGDGSSTFNVPDLQRRTPVGAGATAPATDSVGASDLIAAASRTLTHKHTNYAHYHGMGTGATLNITSSGTHTTSITHDHASFTSGTGSAHSHGVTDPGHVHSIWTSTDVPGAGSNRRGVATTAVNLTASMNSATTGITIDNESAHTHSIDVPNFSGNSSSDGAHTHAAAAFSGLIGLVTGGVDGNSNQDTSGTAPNYLIVNYIIKT